MLYEKSHLDHLSDDLFRNPDSEYRGAPFWAWNCRLDEKTIDEQTGMFQKMGFGGYHVHVRTGLDTPYLGDEYMHMVRRAIEDGKAKGMRTWLYDEDRWPSGFAGGKVTKNIAYRARFLKFELVKNSQEVQEADNVLALYQVQLNPDGTLSSYRRIRKNDEMAIPSAPAEGLWAAFEETEAPSPWYNGQTYVDTLNKRATQEFIRTTHERYKEAIGDEFGKAVRTMFTDEPEFTLKTTLKNAFSAGPAILPWTDDLPETFEAQYHLSILDHLPQVVWDLPDGQASKVRYAYHDHVTERFAQAYCDTLGQWCRENGLMLTGHMMQEPTLQSQTEMVGEAMRSYRAFALPGIDMLCDFHEYTTAKQAQSAVHQQGNEGMLSELYGVTGWNYDFRGHKLQGDWQAALGVTARVPHLAWMSMKGEAKRDYPASIAYQSPWWDQYPLVEDHFARLNTALTRGTPLVSVGVIHPIETYWLHFGPEQETGKARQKLEEQFDLITKTLLFNLIDFDFICESRLPELNEKGGAPLMVGKMAYRTVLVPGLETMRKTTLERLKAFRNAGGRLVFLGDCPHLVDAESSDEVRDLFEKSEHLPFTASAIANALESERIVDIRQMDGSRTSVYLHQLRQDGDGRWLFIARGKNPENPDKDEAPVLTISVKGEAAPILYDTQTGSIKPLPADYKEGKTFIRWRFYLHDSLLLYLKSGRSNVSGSAKEDTGFEEAVSSRCPETVPVTLAEPNALLLDMAEYAVDEEPYEKEEELLRSGNAARKKLGLAPHRKEVVQPYLLPKDKPRHQLRLRFHIESELEASGIKLALEDADTTKIRWNGVPVSSETDGWYVDKAIRTVPLPPLKKGVNTLELVQPFGERTNTEWCYLLGDFGVKWEGEKKIITFPVKSLSWGDITTQGLPFYTGNLTYHLNLEYGKDTWINVPSYRGALIRVSVDGKDVGPIVYSPYLLRLPDMEEGTHNVNLTLYNTRQNGFGQVHHAVTGYYYQDPNSWRTEGREWTYGYTLFETGILASPLLLRKNS